MSQQRTGNVLSWASDIDDNTIEQAQRAASMPFVHGQNGIYFTTTAA